MPVRRNHIISSTLITNANINEVILNDATRVFNIPIERITIVNYEILKNDDFFKVWRV